MNYRLLWPALVLGLLVLTASAPAASQPAASAAHSVASAAHSVASAAETASLAPAPRLASGAHNDTSTPFNLVSLPALVAHRYEGRDLRLDRVLAQELAYTRYQISYRSGNLEISGVMNVPNRPGRHPVLVLAHGFTPPAEYATGSGLVREQAYLAASGFVVLHTDYRNHGDSDRERPGRRSSVARPLGYAEDLVNAVLALRAAHLPFVDPDRVGLFGRSMGGGVALEALVAVPDLVDAAVLYSPVSSAAGDRFDRWVRGQDSRRALHDRVVRAYGTPERNPRFWSEASARSYLDRVAVPVQIHHGTADQTCPVAWSRATAQRLRDAGGQVELFEYPGEPHRFDAGWPALMRRTVDFFDARL